MIRKIAIVAIALVLTVFAVSCTGGGVSENGKLKVVATIFPAYDFARAIGADRAEIEMLLTPGTESHSYEPSPTDLLKIQSCDIFICNGGESDTWVEKLLSSVDTSGIQIIRMTDSVELVEEETVEGMQAEEEHEEPSNENGHGEGEEAEYDEHVWTSPANAAEICRTISSAYVKADPEGADAYSAALETYEAEISALDAEFRAVVENAARRTIVFGDRFPLRYFAEEYDLDYYAAFPGCASETEPGAATVAFLIDKVKTEGIPVVFYLELSNGNIARAIADDTGAKPLMFHSCHNVTREEFTSGETYITLMRKNVTALREALG